MQTTPHPSESHPLYAPIRDIVNEMCSLEYCPEPVREVFALFFATGKLDEVKWDLYKTHCICANSVIPYPWDWFINHVRDYHIAESLGFHEHTVVILAQFDAIRKLKSICRTIRVEHRKSLRNGSPPP